MKITLIDYFVYFKRKSIIMHSYETDYGHWTTTFDFDSRDFLAFTYEIVFKDGKRYIGVKKFWKTLKVPPNELSARSRKKVICSDWRTYCSSSNDVEHLIYNENYPKSMTITGVYRTYGQACYREAFLQFTNHAIGSDMYLNKQIDVQCNPNCFVDSFYDKRDFKLIQGTNRVLIVRNDAIGEDIDYKPVTIKPDLSVVVKIGNKIKTIKNKMHFCFENEINPITFDRLLNGEVDSINNITLPIKRKLAGVYRDDEYLGKITEYCKSSGLTKAQLIKNGLFVQSKDESRDEYKLRLKELK